MMAGIPIWSRDNEILTRKTTVNRFDFAWFELRGVFFEKTNIIGIYKNEKSSPSRITRVEIIL